MSGWAWFAIIWFGSFALLFVLGIMSAMVRSRWGLSDMATEQIERAVNRGIRRWMDGVDDDSGGGQRGRPDTLPLEFDDVDGLSEQL